ncbi:MAG: hypothetical protein AAGJ95_09900 [Cyanobacteria bacterium J06554_11]
MDTRFLSLTAGAYGFLPRDFANTPAARTVVGPGVIDFASHPAAATVVSSDVDSTLIARDVLYLLVENEQDYSDEEIQELFENDIIVIGEGELTDEGLDQFEDDGVAIYEDEFFEDCE